MAENPLLPHRRLQELHALMLRIRHLEQRHRFAPALTREALLAATAIQAEPGDVLFGEPGDDAIDQILAVPSRAKRTATTQSPSVPARSQMTVAAGIARGLQAAGKGICFAFASAGSRDGSWADALPYAQTARLPLVVIVTDAPRSNTKSGSTATLPAIAKICAALQLPLLSVDGDDAIAVYRVIQESIIRARHGDGPAVVWCSLNRRSKAAGGVSAPLAHMEQYLAARGLKPLRRR